MLTITHKIRRTNPTLRFGLFLIVAIAALAAASIAYATIPDSNGVYSACKLDATGTIRLIDPSLGNTSFLGHCAPWESQITWNQAGQPGPQGPQGPQGPKGTFSSISITRVTKNVSIGHYENRWDTANCPAGSYVTGGGFWVGSLTVVNSYQDGNGWTVQAQSGLFDPDHFTIYATCLSVS